MFVILVPATLLPLITTLFWAERKAKRLGIVDGLGVDDDQSIRSTPFLEFSSDSSNQFLRNRCGGFKTLPLGAFLTCRRATRLAWTYTVGNIDCIHSSSINARKQIGRWLGEPYVSKLQETKFILTPCYLGSMVAMLIIGIVLISLFAIWDLRFASRPVIAPRFIRNRSVVIASLIGFLDFVGLFTYLILELTNEIYR